MTPPTTRKRFICPDCAAEFSRRDHANRHKLIHEQPKFTCRHPHCGLLFHRRDVLKRHEAVHRPENAEKRRRPRRGPLPPTLPKRRQQRSPGSSEDQLVLVDTCSLDGGTGHKDSGDSDLNDGGVPTCQCQEYDGTVCVYCISELTRISEGRLPVESQGAIKFCMTHCIQSHLKWFPFIRCSSLRKNWLLNGRALSVAALGARAIKEYRTLARDLWAEAVRRLEMSTPSFSSSSSTSSASSLGDGDDGSPWPETDSSTDEHRDHTMLAPRKLLSEASGFSTLYSFQTKVILLEYLEWSTEGREWIWLKQTLDIMLYKESKDLADMITCVPSDSSSDSGAGDELCREEIRRTLWKFYCIVTRTNVLFGIKLRPPRLFQTLNMPGDPNQFLALSQHLGSELTRSSGCYKMPSLTLPQVLSALSGDDPRRTTLPDTVSIDGQYVVLHAILHLSDDMVDEQADVEMPKENPPGWQVETREHLHLMARRWRQYFWVPPEILWRTSFPEYGRLQSVMLIIYLDVRISQPIPNSARGKLESGRRSCCRQPIHQYAMRSLVRQHTSMGNCSLMEVSVCSFTSLLFLFADGRVSSTDRFVAEKIGRGKGAMVPQRNNLAVRGSHCRIFNGVVP
ncbi:hypothetical protein HD806DRAFT_508874 [Xylariaceae sp. AK1471]|nr:hypothetical protein HD806DRAFT_508874 [Xylariaceae sp. AK1471]